MPKQSKKRKHSKATVIEVAKKLANNLALVRKVTEEVEKLPQLELARDVPREKTGFSHHLRGTE